MSSKPLLSLHAVTVRFGGLVAAQDVTLSLKEGIIGAIIGPNGAGKTTIFNCITGIYVPSAGWMEIEGKDLRISYSVREAVSALVIALTTGSLLTLALNIQQLWDTSINQLYIFGQSFDWGVAFSTFLQTLGSIPLEWTCGTFIAGVAVSLASSFALWSRSRHTPHTTIAQGIARTFQNIRLFKSMTVIENILIGMHPHSSTGFLSAIFRPRSYREAEKSRLARAQDILSFVGLSKFEHTKAITLPYGHQRRLEIGRALATNPKVLLLDEPAAGMNTTEVYELMDLISRVRDSGVTVLLIEHHMKLVMGISHHITVLEYGQKIAEGAPSEIRNNPRVIAAYLGEERHD